MYYEKFGSRSQSRTTASTTQQGQRNVSASNVWKKLKGPASSSSSRAPTRSQWNPRVEINHYLDTPFADTELDLRTAMMSTSSCGGRTTNVFIPCCHILHKMYLWFRCRLSHRKPLSVRWGGSSSQGGRLSHLRWLRHSHASKTGREQMNGRNISSRIRRSRRR